MAKDDDDAELKKLLAQAYFGYNIGEQLRAQSVDKDDRYSCGLALKDALEPASPNKVANGYKVDETQARLLVKLIMDTKGTHPWKDWDTRISVADLTKDDVKLISPNLTKYGIIDSSTTSLPIKEVGSYIILSKAVEGMVEKVTEKEGAKEQAAKLGYHGFNKDDDFYKLYKSNLSNFSNIGDKIAFTVKVRDNLKSYGEDVEGYAEALGKSGKETEIRGDIDNIANAFDAAIKARIAWANEKRKDKDSTDLTRLRQEAEGFEEAANKLYSNIFELYKDSKASKQQQDNLAGAIKHITHQEIDKKKAALTDDKWAEKVKDGSKLSTDLATMRDKTLLESYLKLEKQKGRYSGGPGGAPEKNPAEKGSNTGKLVFGGTTLLGAGLVAALALTGKDEPANEQTGEPEKKKWSFGRIFGVAAGAVVALASILILFKGHDKDKPEAGLMDQAKHAFGLDKKKSNLLGG